MQKSDLNKISSSFLIAAYFAGGLWVMHFVLLLLKMDVTFLGIIPRHPQGLFGILTGPLVHQNLAHLFANTGPLFFFTAAIMYFYRAAALRAVIWIYLMTGIWVWVAGKAGSHIGASGLVYGFGAFLFFSGVFRREIRSIALSLVIAFFYGGMVWGVLPGEESISWESHLFGALAGTATAWFFRKLGTEPRKRYSWEDEPEEDPRDANAVWNYRQNWPGANQVYPPTEPGQDKPLSEQP